MLIAGLLLVVVIALCAWRAAPAFVRLAKQLGRTSFEIERVTTRLDQRLLPRLEETLGATNRAVRDLEETAELWNGVQARAERALAPIGEITIDVERALHPLVQTAQELGLDRRRARAFRAGVRAAWWSLRRASASRREALPADHPHHCRSLERSDPSAPSRPGERSAPPDDSEHSGHSEHSEHSGRAGHSKSSEYDRS